MPDAAGLMLACDQDDARAYAKIVRRVTGKAPELILSDDPKASKKIERFATGSARIAVCVRMVSEGVDVPRAAVLAWMTSYRTPLFFAQAVGRVVRARGAARVRDGVPARRPAAAGAGRRRWRSSATTSCRRRRPRSGDELDLEPLPARRRRGRAAAVGGAGGRRPVRARAARRDGAHRRGQPARRRRRRGRGVRRHPRPADPRADRRAAVASGTTSCGCGSRPATAPTATTSWSSRTTRTRTTPAGRGGTPPSCAGRSTGWSPGCRRGPRTPHAVVHTQLRAVGARPAVGVGVGRRPAGPPGAPAHDALNDVRAIASARFGDAGGESG